METQGGTLDDVVKINTYVIVWLCVRYIAGPAGRSRRRRDPLEIVEKLVATADVVVANLPPEVLRNLALDSLRRVNPTSSREHGQLGGRY